MHMYYIILVQNANGQLLAVSCLDQLSRIIHIQPKLLGQVLKCLDHDQWFGLPVDMKHKSNQTVLPAIDFIPN